MVTVDYERRWQPLKAWLSAEMERCKNLILTEDLLSSDQLIRLHERIHSLASVKSAMERMEQPDSTDYISEDRSE